MKGDFSKSTSDPKKHYSEVPMQQGQVQSDADSNEKQDINRELMLDANATAGLLCEIFGVEMTASPTECAACDNEAEVGHYWHSRRDPALCFDVLRARMWCCESFRRRMRSISMRAAQCIFTWKNQKGIGTECKRIYRWRRVAI